MSPMWPLAFQVSLRRISIMLTHILLNVNVLRNLRPSFGLPFQVCALRFSFHR